MEKTIGRKPSGSKAVGDLIRDSRRKIKMTGKSLADLAGINKSHISKIEHGAHAPDFSVAVKIAQILKEPKIVDLFLSEQHPDITNFYADAIKMKKLLDKHNLDFKSAYNKLVKGQPL